MVELRQNSPGESRFLKELLTAIISSIIDIASCGMRLSIPLRSRDHVDTYSRWINALELVCVLGAIFWGAILRSHFPSTPLSDADTWGYLNPALSWLGGLGFQQTNGRSWLYPAILAAILKIGGDFSSITYAQHVQGLLAAVVMWQTYRLWQ